MKLTFIIALVLFSNNLFAGYTVKVLVSGRVENRGLYISGKFNGWNPGDSKYKLRALNDSVQEIILTNIPEGSFEFTFTKGDWAYIETTETGFPVPTRKVFLNTDTVIHVVVRGWNGEYVPLEHKPDTLRFRIMMEKGEYYLNRNLDSSYKYAMLAYPLALKLNSKEKTAYALDLMGELHNKSGYPQEAVTYLLRELELRKQLNDSIAVANTYINIAYVFANNGDEEKSMEYFRESLNWGRLQPYNESQKEYAYKATALNALGRYYFKRNQLDSAAYYAERAAVVFGDHDSGPITLMGDIYKKQGKIKEAIAAYLMVATGGHNDDNNLGSMAGASNMLAKFYLELGQVDSAFWFARRSFSFAAETKSPYSIAENGLFLISLFEKEKQYDSAFFYQKKVMEARERSFSRDKERQLQAAYFNEKIRQQDLVAQNENFKAQFKIYILLGSLVVLLLLALQYRSRLKTNFYKKNAAIEMKALRAQMNPHFIFNCLTSINRYIVKSDNKTASNYLTKFSKLIRLILDNSATDYISLDTEIQTLQLYMDMEALRFDHAFKYEIQTDDAVSSENISIPSMLVQPYVENAIWHGLLHLPDANSNGKAQGKLWIRFLKEKENILKVEIEDNGVGRQKAKEIESKDTLKKRSYGMQISKDRIELINKLYKYNTAVTVQDLMDDTGMASGTKIILTVPVNNMPSENLN
jgi:hypothetical protein